MDTTRDQVSGTDSDVPAWVQWFQNVARPAVAVIILVMCAPGEHHLAVMAGWTEWLAWGMPGCLVVYTGIAAVVATKRAKGAPGKRTAVAGAVLALALAMSAQPVSHLFVTNHWTGDPVALVVVVSCIPPLVAGHLWHLAASPSQLSALVRDVKAFVPDKAADDTRVPDTLSWDKPWTGQLSDTEFLSQPVLTGTPDTDTGDSVPVLEDMYARPAAVVRRPAVRSVVSGSVPSVVRDALTDNPDASDADLRDIVINRLGQDVKADTIRKAIYRARRAA